jgi:hypothetical protein
MLGIISTKFSHHSFKKKGSSMNPLVTTPPQKNVVERKNGHLLDITRALLFHKHVPKQYWGEAVLTAAHLINRLPTLVFYFKNPIGYLTSFFPNFNASNDIIPRIFGSVAFVHSQNRGKLDPRALRCIVIGYSSTQKGYKCYHPSIRGFYVNVDDSFDEKESFFNLPIFRGRT